LHPFARAMSRLSEENPVDIKKVLINSYTKRLIPGKTNNRKEVIEAMIAMTFEGKKLKDSNNNATLIRIMNTMLKTASHTYFALDVQSAVKNYLGARWQISQESFRGKYYTYKDYVKARPWAVKTSTQISQEIYSTTAKSLNVQLTEVFDVPQGRMTSKFGESPGRSLKRDVFNFTWFTSHRKWLELEASLEQFGALMNATMIKIKTEDGEKEISYLKAWEIDEKGRLKLKEGIDKKYDINGSEFNRLKHLNHELSNKKQGAYAELEQPAASRYLMFRPVIALKKYFSPMLIDRWGHVNLRWESGLRADPRINLGMGQEHMGWYIQNLVTFSKLIESRFKYALTMTKEEKRALMLGALGVLRLKVFSLILTLLWDLTDGMWGWDDDDEDRNDKLKARSGALPSFWTEEKYTKDFNVVGWLSSHLTLMAIEAQSEYENFIPLPGYGLNSQYQTVAEDFSIAFGGSIKIYRNILEDLYFTATGNKIVEYQKKAGVMKFQQEGSNKFWADFWRLVGIKEKYFDPSKGIKNRHSISTSYRR
jgi:hypothetical protein